MFMLLHLKTQHNLRLCCCITYTSIPYTSVSHVCVLFEMFELNLSASFFFLHSLQKYVREQILLAVAVIVKRGSLDKSINCKSIFHEVSQLISSGNPTVVRLEYPTAHSSERLHFCGSTLGTLR